MVQAISYLDEAGQRARAWTVDCYGAEHQASENSQHGSVTLTMMPDEAAADRSTWVGNGGADPDARSATLLKSWDRLAGVVSAGPPQDDVSELAELPERVGGGEVILDLKQRDQLVGI